MENNTISEFATIVSIVSSIVAIAAVSICSILSAYITQRGTKKAKQTELLFHEMISAYYDYLRASGEFSNIHDSAQITRYQDAFSRAALFASKDTQILLKQHKEFVARVLIAKDSKSNELNELAMKSMEIEGSLIQSMQKDLRK